jgi:large subunit ribosomal protein L23
MGLLDRIRKDDAAPKKETKKTTKKAAVAKDVVTTDAPVVNAPKKALPASSLALIRRPRVTEKSARLAQTANIYTFDVPCDAEKIALKKTIEKMYNVRVLSVHTVRGDGKTVLRGRIAGSRNRWKKALVKLAPGQSIDIYASAS